MRRLHGKGKRQGLAILKDPEGKPAATAEEKDEIWRQKFFEEFGESADVSAMLADGGDYEALAAIHDVPVAEDIVEEVQAILQALPRSRAPGPDRVTYDCLRCAPTIYGALPRQHLR